MTHGPRSCGSALPGCCLFLRLSAQTLQQAETLWKARRYVDANEVFKALEAKNPERRRTSRRATAA